MRCLCPRHAGVDLTADTQLMDVECRDHRTGGFSPRHQQTPDAFRDQGAGQTGQGALDELTGLLDAQ